MKTVKFLAVILGSILMLNGCAIHKKIVLEKPVITINESIERYKYIYITPTSDLTSSAGSVYGGNYGVYGATTTKSVNPGDVIAGILIKEGFIRLPDLKAELADETLIVNYGESGRRYITGGLGSYTIEVTIQIISVKSQTVISSCTAEGMGETEADDIRQAITRCLSGLLSK